MQGVLFTLFTLFLALSSAREWERGNPDADPTITVTSTRTRTVCPCDYTISDSVTAWQTWSTADVEPSSSKPPVRDTTSSTRKVPTSYTFWTNSSTASTSWTTPSFTSSTTGTTSITMSTSSTSTTSTIPSTTTSTSSTNVSTTQSTTSTTSSPVSSTTSTISTTSSPSLTTSISSTTTTTSPTTTTTSATTSSSTTSSSTTSSSTTSSSTTSSSTTLSTTFSTTTSSTTTSSSTTSSMVAIPTPTFCLEISSAPLSNQYLVVESGSPRHSVGFTTEIQDATTFILNPITGVLTTLDGLQAFVDYDSASIAAQQFALPTCLETLYDEEYSENNEEDPTTIFPPEICTLSTDGLNSLTCSQTSDANGFSDTVNLIQYCTGDGSLALGSFYNCNAATLTAVNIIY